MEKWNAGKPEGKPQCGVILIEFMDSIEFGGASHRNMKLDCWALDFTGDNNITVRCTFEINLTILFYQYYGALHLWIICLGIMEWWKNGKMECWKTGR
jgi:hypothetical protein